MKPGRNDPCPCGSGKKYKHCHLQLEQASDPDQVALRRLQRTREELTDALSKHALSRFGSRGADEAWHAFNLCADEEFVFDPESPHIEVFFPWFLYNWRPAAEESGLPAEVLGMTAAESYLQTGAGRRLDPFARRYLEACRAAVFSFYEVVRCEPGRGLRLRDLLLGSEVERVDASGFEDAEPGDLLFARVVALDRLAVLDGCTPELLPPDWKPEIIALREGLAEDGRSVTPEVLREHEIELIERYLTIANDVLCTLPHVSHADDDSVELYDVIFDIDSPQAAFEALKDLAAAANDEELLEYAEFDAAGGLLRVEIPWREPGGARHAPGDRTTLGFFEITPGRLTMSVDCVHCAAHLREVIEERLGAGVRYRGSTARLPESPVGGSDAGKGWRG